MKKYVIRTIKKGKKIYHNEKGTKLKSFKEKFYIPPAYPYVKINKNENGKILAKAKDEKNRSQYIYNKKIINKNKKQKFKDLYNYGSNYKKIKADIIQDMDTGNDKIRDISMVLYLIIHCNIRIGNKKYTKENKSFGASTLKKNHFKFNDEEINISFKGKKGVINKCVIKIKDHSKWIIDLFKSRIKKNNLFNVSNIQINNYLKKYGDISSKDIRTWNANILFIKYLVENKNLTIKNNLKNAISFVSYNLHNTQSVAKKEYIDPKLYQFYEKNKNKFINYFKKNYNKKYLSFLEDRLN